MPMTRGEKRAFAEGCKKAERELWPRLNDATAAAEQATTDLHNVLRAVVAHCSLEQMVAITGAAVAARDEQGS